MSHVYGIYVAYDGEECLQQPLYFTKEKAVAEAEKIVVERQKDVTRMHDFFFKEGDQFNEAKIWKTWKPKGKSKWVGGARNSDYVRITNVEVV